MSIVNTSKPSTSFTNSTRVGGLTWATWTTAWGDETRTWAELDSLLSNTSKPKLLGAYTFDEIGGEKIEDIGGRMSDSSFMINTAKP